jgi:hypothetical protein
MRRGGPCRPADALPDCACLVPTPFDIANARRPIVRLNLLIAAAVAALAPLTSTAALLSHGALSRDTATPFIEDSLNQRQWLGWDVLSGLTYAQTVALTAPGALYEGWLFADLADAQRFADALVGTPNACTTTANADEPCGVAMAGLGALVGLNGLPHFDFAWFLSGDGEFGDVGLLTYADLTGTLSKWNEWGGFSDADAYGGQQGGVAWLLYRQHQVAEPPALALLGLGLAIAGWSATTRRRPTRTGPRTAGLTS